MHKNMEDLYQLNQDCISEFSQIMPHDQMLLSFSCCFKANRKVFFLLHTFVPNNKYKANHIKKFTHVNALDLTNTSKFIRPHFFQNLERLIVSKWNPKAHIHNPSKLTYLKNKNIANDNNGFIPNLKIYSNLKHLVHPYTKDIESLIYLQSLHCEFEKKTSNILDFSLLSNLTKLFVRYNVWDNYICADVAVSEVAKLIELNATNVNFLHKLLDGSQLKYLDLDKVANMLFSNLENIKIMHIKDVDIKIANEYVSYQYLIDLKIKFENKISLNFVNMINLKNIEVRNYQPSKSMNLSFLTSLERMLFVHNTDADVNIINLTNLTFLNFINCRKDVFDLIMELPTSIVNFYFKNCDRTKSETSVRSHNLLTQIERMKNLERLKVHDVSLNKNNLNLISNFSLTKLILDQCAFKDFVNLTNLKHFKLKNIYLDEVNINYLSSLKKITLKSWEYLSENKLNRFYHVEDLKISGNSHKLIFDSMPTLTNLKILNHHDNCGLNVCKLSNLKKLTLDDPDVFWKLCWNKFPSSLEDIYVKIPRNQGGDVQKLLMKDVNIHFIAK